MIFDEVLVYLGIDEESAKLDEKIECDVECRCVVCARCGKHTGNSNQGHWWAWCKVSGNVREFHFCCPDNCELK